VRFNPQIKAPEGELPVARPRKTKTSPESENTDTGSEQKAEIVDESESLTSEVAIEEPEPTLDATDVPESETVDQVESIEPPKTELQPQSERKSVFVPMIIGGAVAAGLGFGAATYVMPPFLTPPTDATAQLTELLKAQDARITALGSEVRTQKPDPAINAALEAQAAAVDQINQDLQQSSQTMIDKIAQEANRLDDVDARLAALEKRPVASGAASVSALDAFGREMASMRSEMIAQREAASETQKQIAAAAEAASAKISAAEANAARLKTESETTANRATARAALSRIQAALESGAALTGGLADLAAAGITVPAVLADQAQGIPSLNSLRQRFPQAARSAISASLHQVPGNGTWNRVESFLRSQTGARSLTPKAGDDPDAVLSRSEAALATGDLVLAISELSALPPEGQAQMTEWVTLAQRRIAATEAVAALVADIK
jgi:hypothetical protein